MTNQGTSASAISINHTLTENPPPATMQTVPESKAIRHDYFKQFNGGNVKNTQPPLPDGFFMSAISGDCTNLPGVVDYKIPSCGKVHSVSVETLEGTRQLYCCHYFKQFNEKHDMQNTHATGAPAPISNGRCLIHSSTLLNVITQAKQKRRLDGRGSAYTKLLTHFHKAILPAFLIEAGSLSEAARLLGIHRETLRNYADQAGIDTQSAGGVAA